MTVQTHFDTGAVREILTNAGFDALQAAAVVRSMQEAVGSSGTWLLKQT